MLIDTHAHVNFNAYKNDADEVIGRALDHDVWMINVGSQYTTSKRAVEIAEKYESGVYAAVGLHPIHLAQSIFKTKIDTEEIEFKTQEEDFDAEKYRELAKSKKVVAIGEVGLDYYFGGEADKTNLPVGIPRSNGRGVVYYKPKGETKLGQFKQKQKDVLLKQLDLAQELNLPVMFHCRSAHEDLIGLLQGLADRPKGVIHCFTGNWQQAQKYMDMGFSLGINGIIFKFDIDEVIQKVPLKKILLETDCPYLTPSPITGRNEPLYVKYVAEKVAELKGETVERVGEITTQNAKELFKI